MLRALYWRVPLPPPISAPQFGHSVMLVPGIRLAISALRLPLRNGSGTPEHVTLAEAGISGVVTLMADRVLALDTISVRGVGRIVPHRRRAALLRQQ
jgi:hypothetical protein